MQTWNRRTILRMIAAALFGCAKRADATSRQSINYRADAVILLLGMPVFSRAGVGGGYAEATPAPDASSCSLRFAGYSRPDQARGLDRSGYVEEIIQEENGSPVFARYFGFMTSSSEETAEQARKALAAGGKEVSFAAIRGASFPGSRESSSASFGYPRESGEKDWRRLLAVARESLAAALLQRSASSLTQTGCATPTFLYCIRRAMASPEKTLRQRFVYGDREMFLETEKVRDTHARNGEAASGAVFRLTGKARKREHDSPAFFRIWFEENSSLPFRIDYQPCSFLRLSFVRVASDPNLHARFTEP